jgi:hypothetical protein
MSGVVRVGLIADVQYSTQPDFGVGPGQIAWASAAPWPVVYSNRPTTRRYARSLDILRRGLQLWDAHGCEHAVILGDLLDKTAQRAGEVAGCLATLQGALRASPARKHFLFGNGDAQILKRAGWVAHGFAAPGCTEAALYYSAQPAPGVRFIFLDTYDESAGRPGLPAPARDAPPAGVVCEASSEAAFAAAEAHLAAHQAAFAGLPPGEEATWRACAARLSGAALTEAYAAQPYNGGVGAAQAAWLDGELRAAGAAGEAVFVFGHCPAHPFTCKPDGLQWRAAALRGLLERHPCVQAYVAGHDHDGGYFFEGGVHYLVPPAPLESEEEECFGMLRLGAGEWALEWRGKAPPAGCGTLRGGEWPSGRPLPYRGVK